MLNSIPSLHGLDVLKDSKNSRAKFNFIRLFYTPRTTKLLCVGGGRYGVGVGYWGGILCIPSVYLSVRLSVPHGVSAL